jgi:hypothetical protein
MHIGLHVAIVNLVFTPLPAWSSTAASMRRLKPGMGDRGEVLLAPGAPGEIILLHLDGATPWAIQKGEQG